MSQASLERSMEDPWTPMLIYRTPWRTRPLTHQGHTQGGGDGVSEHPISSGLVKLFIPTCTSEYSKWLALFISGGFLTALECTKSVFAGEFVALPRPSSWFKGALLLTERWEKKGRKTVGYRRRNREMGRMGRGVKGSNVETQTPPPSIPAYTRWD